MKRYQQQHEQGNVWRQGPTVHHFLLECRVRAPRTAQDAMNQEDTQDNPHSAQVNPGTATPAPPKKRRMHAESNLHQPNARQTKSERQILICLNLDRRKPIPAHTNTPPAQAVQQPESQPGHRNASVIQMPPRVSLYLPCTSTPNPAHQQEATMRGPHLLQYKNIHTMYKVSQLWGGLLQ